MYCLRYFDTYIIPFYKHTEACIWSAAHDRKAPCKRVLSISNTRLEGFKIVLVKDACDCIATRLPQMHSESVR